jgi:hypothetical protein
MLFLNYDQRILIDLWFETCALASLSPIDLAYHHHYRYAPRL